MVRRARGAIHHSVVPGAGHVGRSAGCAEVGQRHRGSRDRPGLRHCRRRHARRSGDHRAGRVRGGAIRRHGAPVGQCGQGAERRARQFPGRCAPVDRLRRADRAPGLRAGVRRHVERDARHGAPGLGRGGTAPLRDSRVQSLHRGGAGESAAADQSGRHFGGGDDRRARRQRRAGERGRRDVDAASGRCADADRAATGSRRRGLDGPIGRDRRRVAPDGVLGPAPSGGECRRVLDRPLEQPLHDRRAGRCAGGSDRLQRSLRRRKRDSGNGRRPQLLCDHGERPVLRNRAGRRDGRNCRGRLRLCRAGAGRGPVDTGL